MLNAAFASWVAEPSCKSIESAMQSLNKAWHRYKTQGATDEKVQKLTAKAIAELQKTAAAADYAGLDICNAILLELVSTLQAFQRQAMPEFGFDAISYSLVRLPTYLRLIASGAPDLPAALFDVLNCARMANGKSPYIEKGWVSSIDIVAVALREGKRDRLEVADKTLRFVEDEIDPTLRFMHEEDDIYFLLDSFQRILKDIEDCDVGRRVTLFVWLLQGVVANAKANNTRIDLLSVLCIQHSSTVFKMLFRDSVESAEASLPDEYLDLLTAIIGYAPVRADISESILERLGVTDAFPDVSAVSEIRSQLGGANLSSVEEVYPLLLEELDRAIRGMNLATTSGRFKNEKILTACDLISHVSSTLEVVGDTALSGVLRQRNSAMLEAISSNASYEELVQAFEPLTESILFTKKSLRDKAFGLAQDIFSDLPVDRDVIHALIKEARAELRIIRQKLGIHYETGEAPEQLTKAVRKLAGLSSGLTMVDLGNTSNSLRHLAIFIFETVRSEKGVSHGQLKNVATALTAVETRLEYLGKGLIPPESFNQAAETALSELFGPEYSKTLPPLPDGLALPTSEEGPATSADFLPLATRILDVVEGWDGTPNETWLGLRNLFGELGTIASLLEYRLVDRLIRDLTNIGSHFDDVDTWSPDLSELAFNYVHDVATTLVQATGDSPHLPDNCINDIMTARDQLAELIIPIVEPIPIEESDETIEVPASDPEVSEPAAEDDALDEELIAVFDKEYAGLSTTLSQSLEDFTELPQSAIPSDSLITACHTLRGVSYTIERPLMSKVFAIWEELLKERQSDNQPLSHSEIELFALSVRGTDVCARGLRSGAEFPDIEEHISALETAYEEGGETALTDASPEEAVAIDNVQQEPADPSLLDSTLIAAPSTDGIQIDGFEEHDGAYDDEMLSLYIEEADSELNRLDDLIGELDADPTNEELHVDIKRLMHTLKGSSNMAGATTIGAITHELEELLSGLEVGSFQADSLFVKLLAAGLDALRRLTLLARQRQILPTPWHLLKCIQLANEDDELDEELVNNALKESLAFVGGPDDAPLQNHGQNVESSATVEPLKATEENVESSPKGSNTTSIQESRSEPPKSRPVSNGPVAKVKRISQEYFEIKDDESFDQTLGRLRRVRDEQAQNASTGGATPPKVKVDTVLLDQLLDSAFAVNVDRDRVIHYRELIERSESVLRKLTDNIEAITTSFSTELQQLDAYHRDHPEIMNPDYLDHVSALKALCRDMGETNTDLRSVQETIKSSTRNARSTTRNLTKTTRSLRENLFNTRLVPVRNMLSSLKTVTTKTGEMVSKDLAFVMRGENTKIDRNLLDTLTSTRALEHLIRNSADHGIEDADTRLAAGKQASGTIMLTAQHEGDRILLKLSDDGAGVNPERVKAKAIEKGIIPADAELSEQEILQLITSSGFSTAAAVTQVSGRGVGLDVVRSTIEGLGGVLSVRSTLGQGTEFVLDLPYTQGVSRAIVVGIGEMKFAIPTVVIESFGYVTAGDISGGWLNLDGASYRCARIDDLCGLTGVDSPFIEQERLSVVVIKDAGGPFAVVCGSIIGMQSLHLKPVPFFKDSLRGVLGVAETIDGSLLTVIDPRELKSVMLVENEGVLAPTVRLLRDPPLKNRPLAVVTDDSVALRKSATRFLERMGYQVEQATNGREAIALLESCNPSILVTDLEMPQMDGFELTRHLRSLQRFSELPIVMVTSRSTEEMERTAFECGVSCFLPKPFNAEMLAEAIEMSNTTEVRVI